MAYQYIDIRNRVTETHSSKYEVRSKTYEKAGRRHFASPQGARINLIVFLLLTSYLLLLGPSSIAAREDVPLKSKERRAREQMAALHLRRLQINRIQDPVAREAIREILRYLKLSAAES